MIFKKITTKKLRIPIYFVVICLAFIVAHIFDVPIENKKREQSMELIKSEIEIFWDLEKGKIDAINAVAREYIEKNNLEPGAPLPPNTFANPKHSIGRMLNSKTTIDDLREFEASSGDYTTKVVSLVTVTDKVPKFGEEYAYGGLEHNYEIFGANYTIYPKDKFSTKRMKESLKRVSSKKN